VSSVDSDLTGLSRVQSGFGDLARLADDVLADADADQQFVEGSSGELYAPARDRKLALVKKMIPTLNNGPRTGRSHKYFRAKPHALCH